MILWFILTTPPTFPQAPPRAPKTPTPAHYSQSLSSSPTRLRPPYFSVKKCYPRRSHTSANISRRRQSKPASVDENSARYSVWEFGDDFETLGPKNEPTITLDPPPRDSFYKFSNSNASSNTNIADLIYANSPNEFTSNTPNYLGKSSNFFHPSHVFISCIHKFVWLKFLF